MLDVIGGRGGLKRYNETSPRNRGLASCNQGKRPGASQEHINIDYLQQRVTCIFHGQIAVALTKFNYIPVRHRDWRSLASVATPAKYTFYMQSFVLAAIDSAFSLIHSCGTATMFKSITQTDPNHLLTKKAPDHSGAYRSA
jgi:hypothetical protein